MPETTDTAPTPTAATPPTPAPRPRRVFTEEHKAKVRANGRKGGNPIGVSRPPLIAPTPERTAAAIEHAALNIIEGKPPYNGSRLINPINENDRRAINRFSGITAEEFTDQLGAKLRSLADLTADRIMQKLVADQYRPHELSFLLTVGVDKLKALEGRNAISAAAVNVQINNFGPQSKDEILARLTGQSFIPTPPTSPPPDTPVPPIEVAVVSTSDSEPSSSLIPSLEPVPTSISLTPDTGSTSP